MEGNPFLDTQIDQPVIHQIEDRKAIGRIGVCIDVNPGLFRAFGEAFSP